MQPLESVDLESRAVAKRAAHGHAYLAEQVVGLRTLAAAHLVADGDERAPLPPGLVEPRLVILRGTSRSSVSWVEGGGTAATRKISFGGVVAGSEGTMARLTASPQLEW